ncbi:MAG: bifunctional DNA-formamidopyrimidine glycosylase/DNA-(apurinic or apyrimidinic site) lyase [Hyphomonas sp.]|nr:bifunctional DNA-formamidopyrimidine glycosylase/DNA-(apurinic or apyrimidinic site) lyase [Hyphomonas sp.]MCB9970479.1 bifunctional DNA-formamidopyrimidine glycosylase/DNA-(apurinic or apyrimidinic site) lyase [Hyphomonas sp.]
MPELPEVETVRRGLAPALEGHRIVSVTQNRADLRFPFPENFAARLQGQRVLRLGRRAKFLTADLSSGEVLVMHLGMTGRFTVSGGPTATFHHDTGTDPAHDHVIMITDTDTRITYNDPRRFGFMELWPADRFDTYPRLLAMGPEPLSNGFSAAYLDTALKGKKAPIKAALLDQSVIAGLGNIYVCEALWRARISPKRLSQSIPGRRAERLAPAINEVIAEAIEAGGSSISDFASASGELGYFQHRFAVYDREGEPCPACGAAIRRLVQSGRSTFYCPACQR